MSWRSVLIKWENIIDRAKDLKIVTCIFIELYTYLFHLFLCFPLRFAHRNGSRGCFMQSQGLYAWECSFLHRLPHLLNAGRELQWLIDRGGRCEANLFSLFVCCCYCFCFLFFFFFARLIQREARIAKNEISVSACQLIKRWYQMLIYLASCQYNLNGSCSLICHARDCALA